jgi:AraC-like DNA-binding protein
MPSGGTRTFIDPDAYQASIAGAKVNLVFTGRGDFNARLTRVELPNLRLQRAEENLPRIAYVALAPDLAVVAFPLRADPPPICSGMVLQADDVVFHARGERMHQRTSGPGDWASVSLTPEHLAVYGQVLTGRNLEPPPVGRILRPPARPAAHLRRLHAEACHLAETKPRVLAHPEVARALEHDLLHALVECLTADAGPDRAVRQRHANVMARFEDALAAHSGRQRPLPELCAAIGVPERTLRARCADVLGMSPSRYLLLRRLNLVRAALRQVDPATATVAQQARQHGFSELGRFAASYRATFGETPSATLRRAADRDAGAAEIA